MAFDIDRFYDELYEKVDRVPRGYLEYRLTYAPAGYVYCALDDEHAVYVRENEDGTLDYEDDHMADASAV